MTWKAGSVPRRLVHLAEVAGAILFSLPGGAVLCELTWQSTGARPGMVAEILLALAGALLVAAWLFSPSLLLCSAGWAIAMMGHAALANSTSPGRGVHEQLAWLGVGAALGAVVGPWLVRRQFRETAAACQGAEGAGVAGETPARSAYGFHVTLPVVAFWAATLGVLLILMVRDRQRIACHDRMSAAVYGCRGHVLFDDYGVPTLVFPWRSYAPEDEKETQKSLRGIELGATAGDEQLAQLYAMGLKELPDLSEIRLDQSRVTNDGLVILMPLVHLKRLSLGPAITDAGLLHLNALADLRTLDLSHTRITGQGLCQPRQLPALQILCLKDVSLKDEDLGNLSRFPHIIWLDLANTSLSDAGLAYLTALPNLQWLRVERTRVGDAGVKHFRNMPSLRWLLASHTQLSDAGIDRLLNARPDIAVLK